MAGSPGEGLGLAAGAALSFGAVEVPDGGALPAQPDKTVIIKASRIKSVPVLLMIDSPVKTELLLIAMPASLACLLLAR